MAREKKLKKLTKYELNVEPRLDEIRQWSRDGVIDDEIAVRLDIHISTLYEYVKMHSKLTKVMERPSKFETHVVPKFAEIQQWMEEGLTNDQMCEKLDIAPATWYEYVNKHPMFSDLITWGKSVTNTRVENSLLKAAMGYEYEEIKTVVEEDKNGKKTDSNRKSEASYAT